MLTTDKAGFVYDFGHFVLPYEVKINGGQFLVEKKKLITIDENGYKYDKDQEVEKIKGKGNNYLLTDKNELITIAANGFFYKYDKDDALKKVEKFGGNFFVAKDDKKKTSLLYTLNSTGNYFNIALPELNPAEITVLGGTYFVTSRGVAFTVNKDGFVFKKDLKIAAPKKLGGNFVIDVTGKLFTVSDAGILANPVVPANLNLNNVVKIGANYMLDNDGKLFVVDKNGNVFERSVNSHDLRNVKVISL
jgi:flagellar basal body rod protein FlgF